ncbi:MAG: hypothetical protein JWL70_627 [Acidimicrobiia bacterium]|nr:hypothetical protein [Acidimicrobiia bacterium]
MSPDELTRLEEERRFLLRSLADLDRERAVGDVDDHDYESLKDGYTARAAAVLRAIEAGKVARSGPRRSPWKVVSVLGTIGAFAVVAGLLVGHFSGTRLSSQTGSGAKANSVQAMIVDARGLMSSDPVEAIKQFGKVLDVQPTNVEALTYGGWLSVRAGIDAKSEALINSGRGLIDKAVAIDPKYPDALAFEGVVALQVDNDPKKAAELFDRYFATPNLPPLLVSLVTPADQQARAAAGLPPRATPGAPATTAAP